MWALHKNNNYKHSNCIIHILNLKVQPWGPNSIKMTHQPTRIALDRTKQLAGAGLGLKASLEALYPQEWPIDPQGSGSDRAGPSYSGVTCYIVDRLGDRVISHATLPKISMKFLLFPFLLFMHWTIAICNEWSCTDHFMGPLTSWAAIWRSYPL